jgi:hypothetical protein
MGQAAVAVKFSAADFLAWDAGQTDKHEYVDGELVAMAGVEDRHATVALNMAMALRQHLRGTPCRTFIADVKLHVEAANAYFYPDVFVTCSEADRASPLIKREAVLVVEVLSPGTAAYDRGDKFARYRQLPALRAAHALLAEEHRAGRIELDHPAATPAAAAPAAAAARRHQVEQALGHQGVKPAARARAATTRSTSASVMRRVERQAQHALVGLLAVREVRGRRRSGRASTGAGAAGCSARCSRCRRRTALDEGSRRCRRRRPGAARTGARRAGRRPAGSGGVISGRSARPRRTRGDGRRGALEARAPRSWCMPSAAAMSVRLYLKPGATIS